MSVFLNDDTRICTKSIVIATGVQYRKLPIENLEKFENAGVYYAATKTEARYCSDKKVAVIGGGNSAGQAAMFLSEQCKEVHVVVRGDSIDTSMSEYLSSRLKATSNIVIHYNTTVSSLDGEGGLCGAVFKNSVTNESNECELSGLFIMVGAAPKTNWIGDLIKLDEKGFIVTGQDAGGSSPYQTSCAGVFAVGDVRLGSLKRVASSVGEGSACISAVWQYISELEQENTDV